MWLLVHDFIFEQERSVQAESIQGPLHDTQVSGELTSDTVWDISGSPYVLTGQIVVLEGVTLSIQSGVVVKSKAGSVLEVRGDLEVNGTKTEPVIFTATQSNPTPGFWQGLQFEATSKANLKHFVIEYAGRIDNTNKIRAAIQIQSQRVTIENADIRNIRGDGVYSAVGLTLQESRIDNFTSSGVNVLGNLLLTNVEITNGNRGVIVGGAFTLRQNRISEIDRYALTVASDALTSGLFLDNTLHSINLPKAIAIEGSTLDGVHDWPSWITAYDLHMTSSLEVAPTGRFTLPAGIQMHFLPSTRLLISGTLHARGTSEKPILFTVNRTEPDAGDWHGLKFQNGSQVRLEHIILEYAGRKDEDTNLTAAIQSNSHDVELRHCKIRESRGDSILSTVHLVIDACRFAGFTGVGVNAVGNVTLNETEIIGGKHSIVVGGEYTLTNSIFSGASEYPLKLSGDRIASGTFTNNVVRDNLVAAIEVTGGLLHNTHQWPQWITDFELDLTSSIVVEQSGLLSIPAGVHIKFPLDSSLFVSGTLNIMGTQVQPVLLTAHKSEPARGFWRGVEFASTSNGFLRHFIVEYAGREVNQRDVNAAVVIKSHNVVLENGVIRHSRSDGIHSLANVVIRDSQIREFGGTGVYVAEDLILLRTELVSGTRGIIADSAFAIANSTISGIEETSLRVNVQAVADSVFTENTIAGTTKDIIEWRAIEWHT